MVRRSFIAFHVTLGLALLYGSAATAIHGFSEHGGLHSHLTLVGLFEALGAALFLVPRMLKVGGWLLLLTIGPAFLYYALSGAVRGDLLVYLMGTWFVMAHGPAWTPRAPAAAT